MKKIHLSGVFSQRDGFFTGVFFMNKSVFYLLSSFFWMFLSFVGFFIGGVGWVSFAVLAFFIALSDIYLFISEIIK